jgi:hypothetical protein
MDDSRGDLGWQFSTLSTTILQAPAEACARNEKFEKQLELAGGRLSPAGCAGLCARGCSPVATGQVAFLHGSCAVQALTRPATSVQGPPCLRWSLSSSRPLPRTARTRNHSLPPRLLQHQYDYFLEHSIKRIQAFPQAIILLVSYPHFVQAVNVQAVTEAAPPHRASLPCIPARPPA